MMKKAILSIGLCFLLVFVLSAQESGQITVEKKGMKKIYLHDGETLDSKQLASLLKSNPSSGSANLKDVDLYFGFTDDGTGVGLRF